MTRYIDYAATSFHKPCSVYYNLLKETVFHSVNAGRGATKESIATVRKINKTSEKLAKLFNIDNPSNIAYTQNATYALNMAILGFLNPEDHIIISSMEHNSILRPASKHGNYTIVYADKEGFVSPKKIEEAIKPNTKMVAISHISNVSGSVQDIEKIGKICRKNNIAFLVDAAQSAGSKKIDVGKYSIDILAFSGHKGLLGPLGTGGIYVSPHIRLKPIITGGTGSMSESLYHPLFMPDTLQAGTINAPSIIALGYGVDAVLNSDEIFEMERDLAKKFINDLLSIPNAVYYGTLGNERNGTVLFNIKGVDPAEVEYYLDREEKICVRSGYHCAPLAHKTLGTHKTGAVRASFGFYSTDKDRKALTDSLYKLVKIKINNKY